jgi:purine-cytosine permease-like protein
VKAAIIAGVLIGAIPASVMEVISPLSPLEQPQVITAFGLWMAVGAILGFLVFTISADRGRP